MISSHMPDLETSAPDAFKIITGDLFHCSPKTSTMNYFKLVKCSTWKERILEQCYTKVQDAYTAVSLPPLGRSDHNLIQLIPKYRPLLQRKPIVTRTIKEWSADTDENLKGSLDCTVWDVLVDLASDINELTESMCGYVEFCVQRAIPQKTVKNVPK